VVDTILYWIAGIIGACVLPLIQLPDGNYDMMAGGAATTLFIIVIVVGLVGLWLYEELLREYANRCEWIILTNIRSYIILSIIFWFFVGVLSGCPWYYAGLALIWYVVDCLWNNGRRDWREPTWRYVEDFILAVIALFIGSYFGRDLTMPIDSMSDRVGLPY